MPAALSTRISGSSATRWKNEMTSAQPDFGCELFVLAPAGVSFVPGRIPRVSLAQAALGSFSMGFCSRKQTITARTRFTSM